MLIPRDEVIKQNIRLESVREEIIEELMKYPGVIAVSDGVKRVDGSLIPEICIKVLVKKKKPDAKLKDSDKIPKEIKGFKTDIEEEQTKNIISDDKSYRPLVGGISIGTSRMSGEGTLGCFATVNTGPHTGKVVMLSNYHVMCSVDKTNTTGERIGQPSHSGCCECCTCNEVGKVIDAEVANANLDCAIAYVYQGRAGEPSTQRFIDNVVAEIGYIAGEGPIKTPMTAYSVLAGETVYKRGMRTGFSEGTVSNRGFAAPVQYSVDPPVTRAKSDIMEVTQIAAHPKMADRGDSGSVIVNQLNEVVGLLFFADLGTFIGYASHISYVTARLNIDINASLIEQGVLMSTVPVLDTLEAPAGLLKWMEQADEMLKGTSVGNKVRALVMEHHKEVRDLVQQNREVKLAWNRYSGPQFLNYIARSIRDDVEIPEQIKGVTLQSLLLKMAAVLMQHGSEELVAAVEQHYLDVVEMASGGRRFKDWVRHLEKLDEVSTELNKS